jgi:tryptophan synthase beta chain
MGNKIVSNGRLIPAIESAHAFAVLDEMKFKPEDIVVINLLVVATRFEYVY